MRKTKIPRGHPFKDVALIWLAILALLVPAGTVLAQQNLLVNGGFEQGGAQSFSTATPGWGALTGGAAYIGSEFGVTNTPDAPEEGGCYAWFHATASVTDCIGQTVNTIAGRQYVISFWVATDGPSANAVVSAVWGPSYYYDPDNIYMLYFTPSATGAMPWQQYTYTMTATTATSVFAFHACDQTAGVLLDNVSVTLLTGPQLNITRSGGRILTLSLKFKIRGGSVPQLV